jgi:hypothetical protein
MVGSITGREFAIVFVIALLVIGGSQLPRLVRALTGRHQDRPAEPPPDGDDPTGNGKR